MRYDPNEPCYLMLCECGHSSTRSKRTETTTFGGQCRVCKRNYSKTPKGRVDWKNSLPPDTEGEIINYQSDDIPWRTFVNPDTIK